MKFCALIFWFHWIHIVFCSLHVSESFLFPFSRENSIDIYSGFFRACGLQYEPGNYSIIISIIVLLIHSYDDKSKNLSLFLLAIISIIITKSLVGILLAIILLIFIFFRRSSFSINFVIRFSLLFLVFSGSVLAYVFFRLDNIDSFRSLAQKVYLFDVNFHFELLLAIFYYD